MLRWALLFFVLAVVAAVLGFSGAVSGTLMWAAQVCVVLFVVLLVISLLVGRTPRDPLV